MDVDFATYVELQSIEKVLNQYGFKRLGRCFTHKDCSYIIDFVNPPIAIGHEAIKEFNILEDGNCVLKLLTPTDCVKDRLASFFHWDDKQVLLVAEHYPIAIKNLKRWAKLEGYSNKLSHFLEKL